MFQELRLFGRWFRSLEYSKLSIIRPGRSRLLEFEKKDSTGSFNREFFQISRPEPKNRTGRLIESLEYVFLLRTFVYTKSIHL
jgi:hypothetical protein